MKVRCVLAILCLVLSAGFSTGRVFALTESEFQKINSYDGRFYRPDTARSESNPCYSSSIATDAVSKTVGLADYQAEFVDKNHSFAEALSIQYGIPWETVVAQGINESKSGRSHYAVERNNFFGLNAVDSNPDLAYWYDTPMDGWRGYYEFIRTNPRYRKHGVFSGENITNPYVYLATLKAAYYAKSETYVKDISLLIAAIERRSEEKGWLSSTELVVQYPEMLANAAANASGDSSDVAIEVDWSACTASAYASDGFAIYNQFDTRWANVEWGRGSVKSTIGQSGCGPTSFAMIATALLGRQILPTETAKIAGEAGMYVAGEGSSHSITKVLADHYGLQVKNIEVKEIGEYLRKGWMIHTSGAGAPPFTGGGHYITIRGITADGKWKIGDSNGQQGIKNSSLEWEPADIITGGMRAGNVWAVGK